MKQIFIIIDVRRIVKGICGKIKIQKVVLGKIDLEIDKW